MKRHFFGLLCLLAIFGMLLFNESVVFASQNADQTVHQRHAKVSFPKDSEVKKYRTYKGEPQCREWNETQGCWISEWESLSSKQSKD